ncbi:Protein DRR-1 [Aphelenchoides avenae]|nr:Protein DRR-1 [Aphelenchus avenae]
MENIICFKYPHLFKPVQVVNAVILMICIGSATAIHGSGVLWFVVLTSLVISVVATVLFMLDKSEPVLVTLTGGVITWTVVEFVYSVILSILSSICVWLSFAYARLIPKNEYAAGYAFAGVFLIFHSVLYAVPAVIIYDKMRVEQPLPDESETHYVAVDQTSYQTGETV